MSGKQQTANQLYVTAMMFIPDVLPQKLTLAGIDDLFMQLGAEKAWLEKGHPRLWEGSKQQRVREWFEGITKFSPDLTFPIARVSHIPGNGRKSRSNSQGAQSRTIARSSRVPPQVRIS
jgi:hypothetical protein